MSEREEILQKYNEAVRSLDGAIRIRNIEKRYTAMGYTSNLDMLCSFCVEDFNRLLNEYLPDYELRQLKAPEKIRTTQELLGAIVYYCVRGIGGEVDIDNTDLVEENFYCARAVGGTAVQASMALSGIGYPSVVHLTDNSRGVCNILESPYIYTVSEKGKLVYTSEICQSHEQEVHFIIQFKKGDKICLGCQEEEIPCSNRLILTKITVNEELPLFEPYFQWIENHAGNVSSIVLSSFNAIREMSVLNRRLDSVVRHIQKYRENNPAGIVFFEDAHYHNLDVRKACSKRLYSWVDIVSLNEDELQYALKEITDVEIDCNDIISCVEGARLFQKKFHIRLGLIIHTKDYSMYTGIMPGADIEKGLLYGNLLATAKAFFGTYGTREQIDRIMELDISPLGLQHYCKVAKSKYSSETVLVPTRYIDKPKYTIGLGDSFVAGIQVCF